MKEKKKKKRTNNKQTNKHRNVEDISRRHKEKVAIQTESVVHEIYDGWFESNATYLIMLVSCSNL